MAIKITETNAEINDTIRTDAANIEALSAREGMLADINDEAPAETPDETAISENTEDIRNSADGTLSHADMLDEIETAEGVDIDDEGENSSDIPKKGSNEYSDLEKIRLQDELRKEYFNKCNEIGRSEELSPKEKVAKIQDAYNELGDGNRRDIQCIAIEKYLKSDEPFTAEGRPNPDYPPHEGFNMEKGVQALNRENPMPDMVDRYGDPSGSFVAEMKDGVGEDFDKRALPNVPNPEAYHKYSVDIDHYFDAVDIVAEADRSNLQPSVDKMNSLIDDINIKNGTDLDKVDETHLEDMVNHYNKYLSKVTVEFDITKNEGKYGLRGEAAPWTNQGSGEVLSKGGADQEFLPLSVDDFEICGIFKEEE